MKTDIQLSTELKQQLSAAQIQSLSILSMDAVELHAFLQNEYLENPLLDYISGKDNLVNSQPLDTIFEVFKGNLSFDDNDSDIIQKTVPAPAPEAIKQHLLWQLDCSRYNEPCRQLMEYLIDNMDDNGYFSMPIDQIAHMYHVPVKTAAACLNDLQELEPYGIMAKDLRHCLLKQLEKSGQTDCPVWDITKSYLTEVSKGQISTISRSLNLSTAEVRHAIEKIRSLNPRPLLSISNGTNLYIVPDIILTLEDSKWQIDLNDSWTESYRLNDYYLSMMNNSQDEQLLEYFKTKLERVRFIQQSIHKRHTTLACILNNIIEFQNDYLRGTQALAPMTINQIADITGVHASTVSRAVHGKYLSYRGGTISLKDLFSQAVNKASDPSGGTSAMEVKQLIRQLIHSEDKRKPYSDQKLVELLTQKGIHLSRRTVAKYRDELHIPGSVLRRAE